MGTVDVYRITDELDHPTLDVLATRLEARGKHPRFIEMMQQYLGAMRIDSAATEHGSGFWGRGRLRGLLETDEAQNSPLSV